MKRKVILMMVSTLLTLMILQTVCLADEIIYEQICDSVSGIGEDILQSLNTGNYDQFSANFDQRMRQNISNGEFQVLDTGVKNKIGEYIAKKVYLVEMQDIYAVVLYKAKFSNETSDVIVKVILENIGGKIYVTEFWMDSPKLRAE